MYRLIVLFSCCVVLCVGYKEVCGKNEEERCVHPCPPEKSCRTRNIFFSCITPLEPCKSTCVCKEGFYRNAVGDCITNEECDLCQREHEYFACGSACDNECDKMATQNKTNCPIKSFVCNRKCYCEDGFARDQKGDCIPVDNCNEQNDIPESGYRARRYVPIVEEPCADNEVFKPCMKSCPPDTCLSIVARFKCDSKEPCKRGCVCKPGYLRQEPSSPCKPLCQCSEMRNAPECKN